MKLSLDEDNFRPGFLFDDVKGIQLYNVQFPSTKPTEQVVLKELTGFEENPANEKHLGLWNRTLERKMIF